MRDGEIVASIVAGDPHGLAAAYDRYANPLYRYCRFMVGDSSDAAEAVRDTFVIAASRLPELRDPGRLRAWLYGVARNECLRIARAGKRPPALSVPDAVTEGGDGARRTGLRLLFEGASSGLSPGEREAAELHLRQDLAPAEVAAVLGVSRGHAHSLLSRARDQLEAGLGVLLVDRAGRGDCGELSGMLTGWDGRLTVPLRRRVHRHIERCAACTVRRAFELRPAALSRLPATAALAAGAAESFQAAAGAPASLRGAVLALASGQDPTAAEHQALVLGRAGSFGPAGFPRPVRRAGANTGPRSWPRRRVAVAAVLTVIAAALGFALAGNAGQDKLAGREPPAPVPPAAGTLAAPPPSATPTTTLASLSPDPTAPSASPARPAATPAAPPGTLSVSGASFGSRLQIPPGGTSISLAASGGPVHWSVTVSGDPGHDITASPSSGTLAAGATVQILVTADRQVSGATLAINPGDTVYTMRIVGHHG